IPSSSLMALLSRRLNFQAGKRFQILPIEIGNTPELKSIMNPMRNIIAILSKTFRRPVACRSRGPDKQVNNMFVVMVNEGGYLLAVEIVQTPPDQREIVLGQIMDRG